MSKRHKLYALGAAAWLFVVGLFAYNWLVGPVTTKPQLPSGEVQGTDTATKPFGTTFFNTRIPEVLRQKTSSEDEAAAIKGQYLLANVRAELSDQVGITIGRLDGGIADVSAVQYRQRNPSLYRPVNIKAAPSGAVAFEAVDHYEKGVFWAQGGRYAAVVVSGSQGQAAQLDSSLTTILSNWQWVE